MKQDAVKIKLMVGWNGMVIGGLMTYEELCDSLQDQMAGREDMSADELTDDLARLMGWNPTAITEDQYKVWRDLVNEAAREYLNK